MGAGFSTELSSGDGIWGSVAVWDNENKKYPHSSGKDNWYTLAPRLFDGLTDSDMNDITSIITAKKSAGQNNEVNLDTWCVNHDIIRIISIKWDSTERGYSYDVSIKVDNDDGGKPEIRSGHYPTNRMFRLAIHLEALEDYKKMRFEGGDGGLFKRVSKDMEKYRVAF